MGRAGWYHGPGVSGLSGAGMTPELQYGSLGLLAMVLAALGKVGHSFVSAHLAALQAVTVELRDISETLAGMKAEHSTKLDSLLARSRDSDGVS